MLRWPEYDYWIISRRLSLYTKLDLTDVPKGHRANVINKKIQRLSPFEQTGTSVCLEGNSAMVWIWDEARRRECIQELSELYPEYTEHLQNLTPIVETRFLTGNRDGSVTEQRLDGSESMSWREGVLEASEWSPEDTNKDFQSMIDEPWGQSLQGEEVLREKIFWRLSLVSLCLLVAFQLGAIFANYVQLIRLDSMVGDSRTDVSALLELRQQVRAIQSDNQQLIAWTEGTEQLEVIAKFSKALPASASIREWDFQAGQISVTVDDPELNNRLYIERLSQIPTFKNVTVEPGVRQGSAVIHAVVSA